MSIFHSLFILSETQYRSCSENLLKYYLLSASLKSIDSSPLRQDTLDKVLGFYQLFLYHLTVLIRVLGALTLLWSANS